MNGTMLIYEPLHVRPHEVALVQAPELTNLQEIVGGHLEQVGGFHAIERDGDWLACVAFVDDDSRCKQRPLNRLATLLWDQALRHAGHPGLLLADWLAVEWLVGTVVVLYGDLEFMETL